jgi:signal transduction histidine kinase
VVSEPQRRALGDAEAKAEDLLALIEDLLEVARIEETSVHLDLSSIAPGALLAEIVHEWGVRFQQEDANVTIDVAEDAPVFRADKGLLKRVLSNLIQNALTHSSTSVELTLSARRDASGGVLITVADNGPGIPLEYHELIFRKFERVKNPHIPRTRSSGLGLAFCKLAVDAHGGRIWVQSSGGSGSGSQFHVMLPLEPAPPRGREGGPSATSTATASSATPASGGGPGSSPGAGAAGGSVPATARAPAAGPVTTP